MPVVGTYAPPRNSSVIHCGDFSLLRAIWKGRLKIVRFFRDASQAINKNLQFSPPLFNRFRSFNLTQKRYHSRARYLSKLEYEMRFTNGYFFKIQTVGFGYLKWPPWYVPVEGMVKQQQHQK